MKESVKWFVGAHRPRRKKTAVGERGTAAAQKVLARLRLRSAAALSRRLLLLLAPPSRDIMELCVHLRRVNRVCRRYSGNDVVFRRRDAVFCRRPRSCRQLDDVHGCAHHSCLLFRGSGGVRSDGRESEHQPPAAAGGFGARPVLGGKEGTSAFASERIRRNSLRRGLEKILQFQPWALRA
jgi:hypothetical protein